MMNKDAFCNLFMKVASMAIQEAKTATGREIPSEFVVEMHGAGYAGHLMTGNEAMNFMFISEDKFYRIIDVGVKAVEDNQAILFVRISPKKPENFEMTWNASKNLGPFKIIVPLKL